MRPKSLAVLTDSDCRRTFQACFLPDDAMASGWLFSVPPPLPPHELVFLCTLAFGQKGVSTAQKIRGEYCNPNTWQPSCDAFCSLSLRKIKRRALGTVQS